MSEPERSIDFPTQQRLVQVVGTRHDEALKCAEVGQWIAACALLGAALEGVLLVTAANTEAELRKNGLWPSGDPLRWNLGKLVALGDKAGWFDLVELTAPGVTLAEAVSSINMVRNLLHPGAYVRDMGPEDELSEEVFQAIFNVLELVFGISMKRSGIDP